MSKKPPKPNRKPPVDEVERAKIRDERAARRAQKADEPYDGPKAPPLPEGFLRKGDETQERTWTAVGRALSEWAEMERFMAILFGVFVQGNGAYISVAIRAFGAVRTFEGRLEMLAAASEPFFLIEKDRCMRCKSELFGFFLNFEKTLEKLVKNLKSKCSKRNEIAHGSVRCLFQDKGKEHGTTTYALQPMAMDKKSSVFQVPDFAYSSTELNDYAEEFIKLNGEVISLYHAISVYREQLKAEEALALQTQPLSSTNQSSHTSKRRLRARSRP